MLESIISKRESNHTSALTISDKEQFLACFPSQKKTTHSLWQQHGIHVFHVTAPDWLAAVASLPRWCVPRCPVAALSRCPAAPLRQCILHLCIVAIMHSCHAAGLQGSWQGNQVTRQGGGVVSSWQGNGEEDDGACQGKRAGVEGPCFKELQHC